MTWLAGAALLAWLYLILGHGKFWQAGPILEPASPRANPSVAAIVPARDEAELVGPCLASLLAQDYPALRVVLVDDGSSDGTGEIARSLGNNRLAVVNGVSRPAGWAGKLWAVQQGVAATDSEWLFLTDADILHDRRHLAALMAQAERSGADMVSEMVQLNCKSLAECSLVPAFVYFFQMLFPFARVNDPENPVAAAAGGSVLIRRSALDRADGIEAIRGALIDDVALAAAIKVGGSIWLGHSSLARSVRSYPRFADIWRMVARSAYVQLRFSPLLLLGTVAGLSVLFVVPPLAVAFGRDSAPWLGIAAWLMMGASLVPTLRRFTMPLYWAMLLPAIAGFYVAATLGSALDHHRGRGVVWKQRSYMERRT
ncbi:MAG TPA: glycosyltransferase [Bradyrhizobium sp.]